MLIEAPGLQHWFGDAAHVLHHAVPMGLGVVVTGLGWWFARRHKRTRVPEDL